MPQKVNPILSETVVALSALARDRLAGMLAAMQGTHERSAGEWQIEWDAVPTLFALAAGCLRNIALVFETLEVFPERMRSNLERDGGMVMAEAVMMALAPRTGRLPAHELVTLACRAAREEGRPLADVLADSLDAELRAALPPLEELLAPEAYLGESDAIVASARERWSSAQDGDLATPDTRRTS
jgi:3-carboxy-cis,cis-muconate cycloisomerase